MLSCYAYNAASRINQQGINLRVCNALYSVTDSPSCSRIFCRCRQHIPQRKKHSISHRIQCKFCLWELYNFCILPASTTHLQKKMRIKRLIWQVVKKKWPSGELDFYVQQDLIGLSLSNITRVVWHFNLSLPHEHSSNWAVHCLYAPAMGHWYVFSAFEWTWIAKFFFLIILLKPGGKLSPQYIFGIWFGRFL